MCHSCEGDMLYDLLTTRMQLEESCFVQTGNHKVATGPSMESSKSRRTPRGESFQLLMLFRSIEGHAATACQEVEQGRPFDYFGR